MQYCISCPSRALYVVGFYSPEYNTSESDPTLEITVGLISGKLHSEVVLSLRFSPPMDGNYHIIHMHTILLIYSLLAVSH